MQPGWMLHYRERSYRIEAISADGLSYNMVDIQTGEEVTFSIQELLLYPDPEHPPIFAPNAQALEREIAQQKPPPPLVNNHGLPSYLIEKASHIVQTITSVQAMFEEAERQARLHSVDLPKVETLDRLLNQLDTPVARSTYYKYLKIYDKWDGSIPAIAADLRRSTYHQARLSPAAIYFIDVCILRWRASHRPLRISTLYKKMDKLLERREGFWIDPEKCRGDYPEDLVAELFNPDIPTPAIIDNPEKRLLLTPIELPSRSWFYEYARHVEQSPDKGKDILMAQVGREAYEKERLVFDTFVKRAQYPLQYVFADHWLVDVFTVDDETRSETTRLWFTAFIDAYSRSVLGITLADEEPCIETIAAGLKHAIWPKVSHEAYGITDPWVAYGIPINLFLDNAWAHHSETVRQIARVISQNGKYSTIQLQFRPPYKARYGGLIERLFGNFSGKMKEALQGAIRSSDYKDVARAKKEAVLLARDVDKFLHQLVVHYQHSPHRELDGMTPHQKWVEGIKLAPPAVPPRTRALERLFLRHVTQSRVIGADGVKAFGMTYWSPALAGVKRDQGKQKRKFTFAYDRDDISCIALFAEDAWVADLRAKDLLLPDGSYRAMSIWERKLAMKLAKVAGDPPSAFLNYLDDAEKLNTQRTNEKRAAKRKRSRASENGSKPATAQNASQADAEIDRLSTDTGYAGYDDLLGGFAAASD